MKHYEELRIAAEKVGCTDLLKRAEDRIRNFENREQTGVFIAGGANSGKTTVVNGIVGVTLREPGLLTEEEKPLRVVFEKQDDDETFECHVVANRFWNNEDAVIYEVKNTDILQENNKPGELLDFADIVYYIVSSVMPFAVEDMETIKALSFLPVKVVLNKMDLLDEDAQKKVVEYVTGICTTLGVGNPIIVRASEWESVSKEFRAALPSYEERELLRTSHKEMIRREIISNILEMTEKSLTDIRIQHEKDHEEKLEKSLEAQEKRALWWKLRTRMLEQGDSLSKEIRHNVKGMTAEISEKFLEINDKRNSKLERHIQRQMEKKMTEIAMYQSKCIEKRMKEDFKTMMESAVNLGLVESFGIDDAEFMELTSIRIAKMTSVMDGKESALKRKGANDKGNQIITGTAIAIGLFVVLPLPTAISWIGGIGAGGIGSFAYVKNMKEVQENEWHNMIAEYCRVNLDHLARTLADAVKRYYEKLADTVNERAEAITEPIVDEEGVRILENELKEIEEMCRNMLD